MANFVIGYMNATRMTICPHVLYEGSYQNALTLFQEIQPPLKEEELMISPVTQVLETALAEKAGRLVIVGGTYNDAKAVFVADFVKEMSA